MKLQRLVPMVLLMTLLVSCSSDTHSPSSNEGASSVVPSEPAQSVSVPEEQPAAATTATGHDAEEIYTSIMEAEYLDAGADYEMIQGIESDDPRIQGLITNLTQLHQCSGRFVREYPGVFLTYISRTQLFI